MRIRPSPKSTKKGRRFLGVKFETCQCYGRLYANDEGTAYVGNCPRCNTPFFVRIGAQGTDHRMFVAHCKRR